jgi:hypothetical protein
MNDEAMARFGPQRDRKKSVFYYCIVDIDTEINS